MATHTMGWVLGGWVGCWGVEGFGGSVLRAGRVLGGWVWRWCLVVGCGVGWLRGRGGVWGVQCLDWCWGEGEVLESMFSC